MANAKSHHLNTPETHILVATDGQPREASYTTTDVDGTKSATVHVLYYEKNPKSVGADPLAQTGGEVRSVPYDEWKKPTQPIYEPPETAPVLARDALGGVVPLVWADLVGTDASALPGEAYFLLRSHGGVSAEGKVLAVEEWISPGRG